MLQRQIMPIDRDFDVFALYVDAEDASLDADKYEIGGTRAAKDLNNAAIRQATSTGKGIGPDQIESRTALRVRAGERLSFGTYFNGFPASYWRRWTIVQDVRLTVDVSGRGATVIVYRSLANGRSQRVDSASTGTEAKGSFVFELPLNTFVDGGWYWYNVVAGDDDAIVESAEWSAEVPEDRLEPRHRRHRDHHHEPARLLRQAAHPDGVRRAAQALPRHRDGDGAGHEEGRGLGVLRRR